MTDDFDRTIAAVSAQRHAEEQEAAWVARWHIWLPHGAGLLSWRGVRPVGRVVADLLPVVERADARDDLPWLPGWLLPEPVPARGTAEQTARQAVAFDDRLPSWTPDTRSGPLGASRPTTGRERRRMRRSEDALRQHWERAGAARVQLLEVRHHTGDPGEVDWLLVRGHRLVGGIGTPAGVRAAVAELIGGPS